MNTFMKPFCAAVPWITLGVLILQMHIVSGVYTLSGGTLFELPNGDCDDSLQSRLVALMLPTKNETLIFFDDARYILDDESSMAALSSQLAERAERTGEKAMIVLADKRISGGELIKFATLTRKAGIEKILFAEKRAKGDFE